MAHLLEIEPVFGSAKAQELKLESTCVAGGKATVVLAQLNDCLISKSFRMETNL